MSKQIKTIAQTALIFAIGAAFLYFVFKGTNWADLWLKFTQTNYNWIAVGLLISIVSHWLRAYRATMLYSAMNYRVSTANSLHAVFIGYFINYFIPRGGEVSRCAALTKTNNLPLEKGLGSVITERLVDMVMLLIILAAVFVLQFDVIFNYINTNLGTEKTTENSHLKFYLLGAIFILSVALYLMRKQLAAMPILPRFWINLKALHKGLQV